MNSILRGILKNRKVDTTIVVIASLATILVGFNTPEIIAQSQNQTQQGNQSGIGSIEELEKLTAPPNTTDKSTGLLEGLEKSQLGKSIPGEQDVKFEGNQTQPQQGNQTQPQQGNQTQPQQGNQTQPQQGNQSSGPLQELGEQITGLFN